MPRELVTPPRTPRRVFRPYPSVRGFAARAGLRLAAAAFRRWRQSAQENRVAARYDRSRRVSSSSQSSSRSWVNQLIDSGNSTGTQTMMNRSGGIPIHHSTSGGKFRKAVSNPSTLSAKYSKSGFVYDQTIGGVVTDANCVYIGHTSYPCDRTLYIMCCAFIRALLRNVNIDIESMDSVIPTMISFNNMRVEWIDGTNTTVGQDFSLVGNPSVFALAGSLYDMFRQAIANNARRYYQRVILTTGVGETSGQLYAQFNLAATKVNICNSSYIKIQNNTQDGTNTSPDAENVNAVPLEGFSYFGKGNFTGIKDYILKFAAGDATQTNPLEITAEPSIGVMTLRAPNSPYNSGIASPKEYENPPIARTMKNCTGSAFNVLEPGVIKTDKLMTKVNCTLNQFLQSNYINGYASNNTLEAGQFNRSKRGHFKLFALEKKLFSSTADKCSVRYEVNQFLRSSVYIPKMVNSIQWNEGKSVLSYLN